MQPLRVGVLGPLVVRRDGSPVALGSPMLRALLGLLAVQPHQVVRHDEIVDVLWGDSPPPTCRASLHVHIGRLRTLAEPARARREHGLIRAAGDRGYVFEPSPGQLDLLEFRVLTEQARGADGVDELAHALRCWRGPALAGIGGRLENHPVVTALNEQRTATVLAYADAAFDLSGAAGTKHRELALGLLRELAHDEPLHEGVHARLLLTLAASGEQAAALMLYAGLRTRLADELGVDPGREVTEAHLRVVRHGGADSSADTATGFARPAQLPRDVHPFIGRTAALAQLDAALTGPALSGTPVVVLAGTAGVDKSALAVHWAHRVRGDFPDGQLFVGLQGYARTPPLRPVDALAKVLRTLGVPAGQVPVDLDEAANLYRSLLTGKRRLVLLDNASSPQQVRPLLPGAAGCAALVTSRDRLAGLSARDGARVIGVDVLSEREAADLLTTSLGAERIGSDPHAAAELARTCAFLPLALRIAAANLRHRPRLRLADYIARLRADNPVSALAVDGDEEAAVRAAFDLSYRALPGPAQRLFRLLGLVPGPDVAADAVAALAGSDSSRIGRLLDALCAAHLVREHDDDRYALHDLLRIYAAGQADVEDPAHERAAALDRLFIWYHRGVTGAAATLYPERLRLPGATAPLAFADPATALAWLDAERPSLLAAAQHTTGPVAWLLMDGMRAYCAQRVPTVDWQALTSAGMAAAEAAGDPLGRAAAHLSNVEIGLRRGRYSEANVHCRQALELSRRTGWEGGQAAALGNLGIVCRHAGQVTDAVEHLTESLRINRRAGRVAGEALTLGGLGVAQRELGNLDLAAGHQRWSPHFARWRPAGRRPTGGSRPTR